MYAILGWINVGIVAVMLLPFALRVLSGKGKKSKAYIKTVRFLRTLHKPLGVALLLSAVVHGYLALGVLRLHTGTIAGALLILAVALGAVFFLSRNKDVFAWHKAVVMAFVIMLIVHLAAPSAVYYLLGV